jgi:hypothetical protein
MIDVLEKRFCEILNEIFEKNIFVHVVFEINYDKDRRVALRFLLSRC